MAHKSGFVAIVGRPNTGKSTLTNALVGSKVAITSDKPQTTRNVIRGIVQSPGAQIVLIDTPGIHRPKNLLGERLNELVRRTYADVDVIVMCLPADQAIGPGDRLIAEEIGLLARVPKVAILTKIDRVRRDQVARRLLDVQALAEELGWQWSHIVPVSAAKAENLQPVIDVLTELLPAGPKLFDESASTDAETSERVSEFIREALLSGVREELPHSIAVVIDEMQDRPGGRLTDVFASVYVERDSQKAIVIGRGGKRLAAAGSAARLQIEQLLGRKVMLDVKVKVLPDWQRDPKKLAELGF